MDLRKQLNELSILVDDIIAGKYPQPTALGPNKLSKAAIKAKSITGTMIDVSNLSAVQTKTGSLTVDGNLTIGTGGSLRSGKTSYSDTSNAGFWMGIDSSVAKIRVGNIGHTSGWTWDGTTLAVTGSVSATSGTIGGWTIGTTDLTADSGAIGLASSGSVRIWLGNTTPSSAPFQVSSAGALTATSGAVGGWTIDTAGIRLGSGATARGMDTGSTAFYAGSATPSSAPFRVTTAGAVSCSNLTVTGGTITANALTTGTINFGSTGTFNSTGSVTGTLGNSSGTLNLGKLTVSGQLTLGSGGSIVDADGSKWDQTGITLVGNGTQGDTITWKNGASDLGYIFSSSGYFAFKSASGTSGVDIIGTNVDVQVSDKVRVSGRIYPGASSGGSYAGQATYYIDGAASGLGIITNGIGIGGMLGISSGNTINFISPGSGGSASNWSSFTSTDIPDKAAGYFKIQIAGTNYRVPFYADA